jgi:hypothetical protein
MIFDMGQSNEVDNGWLTWLRKIPQFENHRVEMPEWVLNNSGFKYASRIGHSISHKAERYLCWFTKEEPKVNLSPKMITVNSTDLSMQLGLKVEEYLWRKTGGIGSMHSSTEAFPIMDLESEMSKRYYKATSATDKREYFICEYLYSWLSPMKNFEAAEVTFERGNKLSKIDAIKNEIIPPFFLEGNFIVYPYCNWPQFFKIPREIVFRFPDLEKSVLDVVEKIYNAIGLFDFNGNNILFNYETGDFRLIDFEPISLRFTDAIFQKRIDAFKEFVRE